MALSDNNPENLSRWAKSLKDDDLFAFIRGRIKTKKVIAALEELIQRYNNREWQISDDDFELPALSWGNTKVIEEIDDKLFAEMEL